MTGIPFLAVDHLIRRAVLITASDHQVIAYITGCVYHFCPSLYFIFDIASIIVCAIYINDLIKRSTRPISSGDIGSGHFAENDVMSQPVSKLMYHVFTTTVGLHLPNILVQTLQGFHFQMEIFSISRIISIAAMALSLFLLITNARENALCSSTAASKQRVFPIDLVFIAPTTSECILSTGRKMTLSDILLKLLLCEVRTDLPIKQGRNIFLLFSTES